MLNLAGNYVLRKFLTESGVVLTHPLLAQTVEIVLMLLSFLTGLVRGVLTLFKTVFITTAEAMARLDIPLGNPFQAYRDCEALGWGPRRCDEPQFATWDFALPWLRKTPATTP